MGIGGRKYNIIGNVGTKTNASQSGGQMMTSISQYNQDLYTGTAASYASLVFCGSVSATYGYTVLSKNGNNPSPMYVKTHGLYTSDNFTYDANIVRVSKFSITGNYLLVGTAGATVVYKVDKQNDGAFTYILPTGGIGGATFCSWGGLNDEYFALANGATDGIYVYKRTGDTFASISITGPGAIVYGCDFDPTGTYLTVSTGTAPYVRTYKRTGDTFNFLSNPASANASTRAVRWAPNSSFFVSHNGTNAFIYNRSGDTITRGIGWSPGFAGVTYWGSGPQIAKRGSNYYIAITNNSTTGAAVYLYVPGVSITLIATTTLPVASSYSPIAISPDGEYLYVGLSSAPNSYGLLCVYRITDSAVTLVSTASMLIGVWPIVTGQATVTLAISPF